MAVVFGLMAVPATRPIIFWPILMVLAPIAMWRASRVPKDPPFKPRASSDPALWVRAVPALDELGRELLDDGFTSLGEWLHERETRIRTRMFARVLRSPDGVSEVGLMHVECGVVAQQAIVIETRGAQRRLRTVHQQQSEFIPAPDADSIVLPSFRRARLLWQVHQARLHVAEASLGVISSVPGPEIDWSARIGQQAEREIEHGIAAGIMRRDRSGATRMSVLAAIRMGWRELWPWRGRAAARLRANEERLLDTLGLSHLLPQARAEVDRLAAATPALEHSVNRLTDDRGQQRVAAGSAAAAAHEHRDDPRFRAVVREAAAARRATFSRSGAWPLLLGLALAFVLPRLGVPLWASPLISVFIVMTVLGILNQRLVEPAERAAAAALLRRGLCASCLYSLADLEPAHDGCLVCPECGAAWARTRVIESLGFKSTPPVGGAASVGHAAAALNTLTGGAAGGRHGADHRGHGCTLVSPALREIMIIASPEKQPRLRAARRRMRASGLIARLAIAAVLALAFIGLPLLSLFTRGTSLVAAIGLGLGVFMCTAVLRGGLFTRPSRIVRAMLGQSLCPSCAEDLAARPLEPDGCAVCSCGAAWRPQSVKPPETLATPAALANESA